MLRGARGRRAQVPCADERLRTNCLVLLRLMHATQNMANAILCRGRRECIGVLVDAEHLEMGVRLKKERAVASSTERRIDHPAGWHPGERIPEYYSAKGALPSVTVSLAKHLANTGITVNCVSPGIIATPEMIELFTKRAEQKGITSDWASVEKFVLETGMANPSGRIAMPDDVGRFISFVVSEPAWHLNGAHLRFDGGAADAVT
jgi:NAD(P)-dependent dehydrogenase (short-subunit alcohol dehydrogenase family)